MAETPEHLVLCCSGCGLRYPSPTGDARLGTCPACEAEARVVADYPPAHIPAARPWASAGRPEQIVAVLDSIRSAMNVGTILRAADGAGVAHVHLCGLTAQASSPKVAKTALGAERSVPTTGWPDATACGAELAAAGYRLWALEATPDSVPATDLDPADLPDRLAVIVGNERAGVDPGLLAVADRHLHLNMTGTKTSLNVGVAFGALIYAVRSAQARGAL